MVGGCYLLHQPWVNEILVHEGRGTVFSGGWGKNCITGALSSRGSQETSKQLVDMGSTLRERYCGTWKGNGFWGSKKGTVSLDRSHHGPETWPSNSSSYPIFWRRFLLAGPSKSCPWVLCFILAATPRIYRAS